MESLQAKIILVLAACMAVGFAAVLAFDYLFASETVGCEAALTHLVASCCIALVVLVAACIVAFFLSRRITRPLRTLIRETNEMLEDDYVVDIAADSKDEVGMLARAFEKMAGQVGERILIDAEMKSVGSKAAHEIEADRIDEEIAQGTADFTVVMIDVNDLKHVNDNIGHEQGSQLLHDAADLVAGVFGSERSYHWGGDEFVAIIPGSRHEDPQKWSDALEQAVTSFNEAQQDENGSFTRPYGIPLSIAWGIEPFDPNLYSTYYEVFKRADKLMYIHKKAMKKGR